VIARAGGVAEKCRRPDAPELLGAEVLELDENDIADGTDDQILAGQRVKHEPVGMGIIAAHEIDVALDQEEMNATLRLKRSNFSMTSFALLFLHRAA
jgi:hypothetical protein